MEKTNAAAATAATTTAAENTAPAATVTTADENTLELALSSERFAHLDITADLAAGHSSYCSMIAADDKAKVTLYNACSNPLKLSDMINKQIKLLHIFIEVIPVKSELSGEMVNAPRIVLIDEKGTGYQAVSSGIYNSVKRIIALFGDPASWDRAHTVEVQHISLKDGQHTFNLKMID